MTTTTTSRPPITQNGLKPVIWYSLLTLAVVAAAYATRDFDWKVVWDSRLFLARGLGVSWLIAIAGILIGMVFGIAFAVARKYQLGPIRWIAIAYIEIVRATPHLMIFLWVYFVYPEVTGEWISPGAASVVSLSVIASAYLAEVIRAGLDSVDRLQLESGYATGLGPLTIFTYIVLPQALRNMVPALVATFVMIFKITTFVHVLGMIDFFSAVTIVNTRDLAPYALYTIMAIVYFLCCWALSTFIHWLDPKYTLMTN